MNNTGSSIILESMRVLWSSFVSGSNFVSAYDPSSNWVSGHNRITMRILGMQIKEKLSILMISRKGGGSPKKHAQANSTNI